MIIFSDINNSYRIIEYSATHNQLLIRSMKNKERAFNIDILFKGVSEILIPTKIDGLEISSKEIDDIHIFLKNVFDFNNSKEYIIFELKDIKGKIYYINAMAVGIFHNQQDTLESSINRYARSTGEGYLWFSNRGLETERF